MTQRLLATLAALVLAGCSGGTSSKSALPARPVPATGGARVTLTFSPVRRTQSARRAPRFVDPGGAGGVNVTVYSELNVFTGVFVSPPIFISPGTVESGTATISLPLLLGIGFLAIQETDATSGALLAQTFTGFNSGMDPFPAFPYGLDPGVNADLGTISLGAVVGGIVVIEGDALTGTATPFITPPGGTLSAGFSCGVPKTETIFVVGSDALGNISAAGAGTPGALTAAALQSVSKPPNATSSLTPSALVPGAITLFWDGSNQVAGSFSATDFFGNQNVKAIFFGPAC
jgi:hypothetical protein